MGEGGSPCFNLDGLLFADRADRPCSCYVQVFRNGCIEAIKSFSEGANARHMLPAVPFERHVLRQVDYSKRLLQVTGAQPPIVIFLTMVGMKGWRMGVSPEIDIRHGAFDRDPQFIPEVIIETFDGNAESEARPLFDSTWNAGGWSGSINYDELGRWNADQH